MTFFPWAHLLVRKCHSLSIAINSLFHLLQHRNRPVSFLGHRCREIVSPSSKHAGTIQFLTSIIANPILPSPFAATDHDFLADEIFVTLQPGVGMTDVFFPIIDDLILEEVEEGFLAIISLESAMFPNLIDFDATSRRTLIRIRDNDGG